MINLWHQGIDSLNPKCESVCACSALPYTHADIPFMLGQFVLLP